VFGGFAPEPGLGVLMLPSRNWRRPCIEPGRTVEYKPPFDEALQLAKHKVSSCIILQRAGAMTAGRDPPLESPPQPSRLIAYP
jgi:hypothetical protein